MQPIDLDEKFALFDERWRPKVAAELNGQELKLVKVQGTFLWHEHEHEDEMFLVWRGKLRVEFREGSVERTVELGPGQCVVVPRGVSHRTSADEEALVLVFAPAAMKNTGAVDDPVYTAPVDAKI